MPIWKALLLSLLVVGLAVLGLLTLTYLVYLQVGSQPTCAIRTGSGGGVQGPNLELG